MKPGYLSEYFVAVAYKYLSAVEADRTRSNQHEFDGISALKNMLGGERKRYNAVFIYLNDDDPEPIKEEAFLTWYDARENHPTRSEYRLYYPGTIATDNISERDLLIIAKTRDDKLLVIFAERESTTERQLLWLFGISDQVHPGFSVKGELESDQVKLEFASRFILDQIGIEVETTDENWLDQMLRDFGGTFPDTKTFSQYARKTLPDISPYDNPDAVLMAWLEREEILFRTLERHLIGERLQHGFHDDVDAFIQFSLSVQNRRKSRAGYSLENHLEYLFTERGIRYSRTAFTEGRSRPDFLFPGSTEYHNSAFPEQKLTMLGVKTTSKDRWRQILAEADRIMQKHLLTLEPGISIHQTDEMQSRNVQLVLPKSIHSTYTEQQQKWLMNAENFVKLVLGRQK